MAGVKATGRDFIAYWNDKDYWGECYIEDDVIRVNGESFGDDGFDIEKISDTDMIEVSSGVVITPNGQKDVNLTSHLRKWLKARNTTTVLIEVDRDKLEAMLSAIVPAVVANGGKVVSK